MKLEQKRTILLEKGPAFLRELSELSNKHGISIVSYPGEAELQLAESTEYELGTDESEMGVLGTPYLTIKKS